MQAALEMLAKDPNFDINAPYKEEEADEEQPAQEEDGTMDHAMDGGSNAETDATAEAMDNHDMDVGAHMAHLYRALRYGMRVGDDAPSLVNLAIEDASVDCLQLLVQHGAEVNASHLRSLVASSRSFYDVYGASDDSDDNPNSMAKAMRLQCIHALLAAGVDIDGKSDCGNTAMHCAAKAGDLPIIKLLRENHHARSSLRNNDNQTPLDVAEEAGHREVVEYLAHVSQLERLISGPISSSRRQLLGKTAKTMLLNCMNAAFYDACLHIGLLTLADAAPDESKCVACKDRLKSVIFAPCGHRSVGSSFFANLSRKSLASMMANLHCRLTCACMAMHADVQNVHPQVLRDAARVLTQRPQKLPHVQGRDRELHHSGVGVNELCLSAARISRHSSNRVCHVAITHSAVLRSAAEVPLFPVAFFPLASAVQQGQRHRLPTCAAPGHCLCEFHIAHPRLEICEAHLLLGPASSQKCVLWLSLNSSKWPMSFLLRRLILHTL